jgi:hypothetical protein
MPIDPFFGSLVSAGGSFAGSIANGLFGGAQVRRQLKANKELAQYQFDLNRQQWQAENEYNSPKAQMQRLKEAGLNPNLVYGNGSVSGNTTTAGPRFESPEAGKNDRWNFANMASQAITMYQDMQQRQANIDLTRAQEEATRQNAALTAINKAWNMFKFDSDKEWYNRERGVRLDNTFYDTLNKSFDHNFKVQSMGYNLQAIQLANEEARARLRNAALDAVLKEDTHNRNKAMMDSWKYQGDLGRWSSDWLRDFGTPYDIYGKGVFPGAITDFTNMMRNMWKFFGR